MENFGSFEKGERKERGIGRERGIEKEREREILFLVSFLKCPQYTGLGQDQSLDLETRASSPFE